MAAMAALTPTRVFPALLLQIKEKEAEILALKKEKKEIDDKHNEVPPQFPAI